MGNSSNNHLMNQLEAMSRVQQYTLERDEVKGMGKLERLKRVKNARAMGKDWQSVYENIRQIIDPMDCMSDTQIFGVEIPWDLWRG